jgi:tRNA(Ile)-lysidine synthase
MLLNQVKRTIDRHHLLEQGDRLVVGVSGGADSMVLLHVLNSSRKDFNLSLIVAHVNHGLRPHEAEKEAELVRTASEKLGIPFEYGKFNVREFKRAGGFSLQDAARRIRFHFFKGLLRKHQATKIALGHNADDQVETVLINLLRGSGLKGLKGILPIRDGKVIRPLLEVWRREIDSFALKKGIPFFVDSSNLKKTYLRNRLRMDLIPLIEREYQARFKGVVLKTANLLQGENDYLDRESAQAYQRIVRGEKDKVSFNFSEYQSLHRAIQWRVIQRIVEGIYGEEEEGLRETGRIFSKLLQSPPSFRLELPCGVFEKRYNTVLARKGSVKPVPPFETELLSPGCTLVEEIRREVVIEEICSDRSEAFNEPPNIAYLACESLKFPLKMRNFRPGDRFQPLGVKGTQKLKEFYIDHKVPRFERPSIPLLISGEMIAWVVGYRIDERVKVTGKSRKVLRVEVK